MLNILDFQSIFFFVLFFALAVSRLSNLLSEKRQFLFDFL
jgi:hypothetical protein